VKAKDFFILLKPSIDLKKLQSDVRAKYSVNMTPSSTALKQIKSEAMLIAETSSMISGMKRHNSEAPSLKEPSERKRDIKAMEKGLIERQPST
jgi:hypothetical protein